MKRRVHPSPINEQKLKFNECNNTCMLMDYDTVSETDIENDTQNMITNLYGTTEIYKYYKQNSDNIDNNMGP